MASDVYIFFTFSTANTQSPEQTANSLFAAHFTLHKNLSRQISFKKNNSSGARASLFPYFAQEANKLVTSSVSMLCSRTCDFFTSDNEKEPVKYTFRSLNARLWCAEQKLAIMAPLFRVLLPTLGLASGFSPACGVKFQLLKRYLF